MDILNQALKNYPVGTQFYAAHVGEAEDTICELLSEEELKFSNSEVIWTNTDNGYISKVVYYYGKWARIIPKTTNEIQIFN